MKQILSCIMITFLIELGKGVIYKSKQCIQLKVVCSKITNLIIVLVKFLSTCHKTRHI